MVGTQDAYDMFLLRIQPSSLGLVRLQRDREVQDILAHAPHLEPRLRD